MLIKKKIIVKLTSIPLSKNLLHLLKIQAFPIYSFCWIAHFHLVAESSISIISISKIPINATIPNPFSQNLCKPNQTMETLISQNFQPQNHLNFHRKFKHIYMQYPQNPMPPQIKNSNFFFFFQKSTDHNNQAHVPPSPKCKNQLWTTISLIFSRTKHNQKKKVRNQRNI